MKKMDNPNKEGQEMGLEDVIIQTGDIIEKIEAKVYGPKMEATTQTGVTPPSNGHYRALRDRLVGYNKRLREILNNLV